MKLRTEGEFENREEFDNYLRNCNKRHIKKGICISLYTGINKEIINLKKSEEDFKKAVLEVWNR